MNVEAKLFQWGSVPFLLLAVIYGWATHVWAPEGLEWVGAVCLLLVGLMTGMIGFYLGNTARKLDERPEDDPAGEISDAEGDYGFFSPHSWWPILIALSFSTAAVGAALWLPWLIVAGICFVLASAAGLVFEYYVGPEKH